MTATKAPDRRTARTRETLYRALFSLILRKGYDAVTVQDIIKVLTANAEKAKRLVARLAREFPREHEACPIGSDRALDNALITAPDARDPKLLKKLEAVAGRVLGR